MKHRFKAPQATAVMYSGNKTPFVFGRVKFYQKPNCVLVVADLEGLPETETGFYGFHIHQGNSCGGKDFAESGSHYNPENTPHPRHAGDLPPLMLCGNRAYLAVLTDRFTVSEIIGRTVIVHSMPDDFHTQPSGNAGAKIACGVIKRM